MGVSVLVLSGVHWKRGGLSLEAALNASDPGVEPLPDFLLFRPPQTQRPFGADRLIQLSSLQVFQSYGLFPDQHRGWRQLFLP